MSDTAKMIDASTAKTPPPNPLLRQGEYDFAAAAVDDAVNKKLLASARNLKLPGFRPGRVPSKVLWQRYGQGHLIDLLVAKTAERFEEEVKQGRQERAATNLEVTPAVVAKEGVYHVTFHYEVFPSVELPNLDGRELQRGVLTVGDKEIDAMIKRLQRQYGHYHVVARPAQHLDRLKVSYQSVVDDQVVEEGKDRYWVLGPPALHYEVTQNLIGVVADEVREVALNYPEDYPEEAWRGRTIDLKITVHEVAELHPCALNDKFFALCGVPEGGEEAFRKEVSIYLEREVVARLDNNIKTQALGLLMAATPKFPLPRGMVHAEAQVIYRQMIADAKKSGTPLPTDLRPIYRDATQRTTIGLIMAEWIKRDHVTVSEQEVHEEVDKVAQSYEDPAQFLSQVRGNKNFTEQMRLSIFEDKLVAWTLAQVTVIDKPLTVEQFFGDEPIVDQPEEQI